MEIWYHSFPAIHSKKKWIIYRITKKLLFLIEASVKLMRISIKLSSCSDTVLWMLTPKHLATVLRNIVLSEHEDKITKVTVRTDWMLRSAIFRIESPEYVVDCQTSPGIIPEWTIISLFDRGNVEKKIVHKIALLYCQLLQCFSILIVAF